MCSLLKWRGVGGLAGPVASVRGGGSHYVIFAVRTHQIERISPAGVHRSWDPQCHTFEQLPHELRQSPHPKEGEATRHVKPPRMKSKLHRAAHFVFPNPALQKREMGVGAGPPMADMGDRQLY